jgi:hypothetical protein
VDIRKIGIVGAGLMGAGIALVSFAGVIVRVALSRRVRDELARDPVVAVLTVLLGEVVVGLAWPLVAALLVFGAARPSRVEPAPAAPPAARKKSEANEYSGARCLTFRGSRECGVCVGDGHIRAARCLACSGTGDCQDCGGTGREL